MNISRSFGYQSWCTFPLWHLIKVKLLNFLNHCSIILHNYHYLPLTVSGVNIHVITPIVCLVCIFYTSVVSCYEELFHD